MDWQLIGAVAILYAVICWGFFPFILQEADKEFSYWRGLEGTHVLLAILAGFVGTIYGVAWALTVICQRLF
ncbi:MAG: hypothetical protein NXI32_04825 [bacterium]|nr:hypothetical protein [bacterium]